MTAQATMQAVVFHAPGDVRVESLPLPACGADEIRVKVDACAVCGTDLKSFLNGNPRIKAPLTMGHEFTGLVETIGAAVVGFNLGERVVMATSISCGECYCCRRGWPNLCMALAPMGFSLCGRHGPVRHDPGAGAAQRPCGQGSGGHPRDLRGAGRTDKLRGERGRELRHRPRRRCRGDWGRAARHPERLRRQTIRRGQGDPFGPEHDTTEAG